jgi:hypothetical protein
LTVCKRNYKGGEKNSLPWNFLESVNDKLNLPDLLLLQYQDFKKKAVAPSQNHCNISEILSMVRHTYNASPQGSSGRKRMSLRPAWAT